MMLNLQQPLTSLALALLLPLAAFSQPDSQQLDQQAKSELDAHHYENAQKLYQRSLDLREQAFGQQSPQFAVGLLNLAAATKAGRGWEKAVDLYQRALPILEATLGPDHPDVATALYNLARNAGGKPHLNADPARQHAAAMALYQRALDIRTKAFGASDPRVAEVLLAMAQLTGDESLYQRALAVVDTGGQSTSQTATALELYATFLEKHDRAAEASPLQARAKQIRAAQVQAIGRRAPAPAGLSVRAGAGVTTPKLQQPHVEPSYTDEARYAKWQGTVILTLVVGADGKAHDIQLKQGLGYGLDEMAAEAVSDWAFTPGMKDGQPVNFAATVEVNFRLL